jgi:endoglycosylceramidase
LLILSSFSPGPLPLPSFQVYKSFPFYPGNGSFDAEYSFNSNDIAMLVEYGFTVVRLYVAWPGVEPTKGKYNTTYLDTLYKIVDQLGRSGVYTILDCHQDLWSPKFCGMCIYMSRLVLSPYKQLSPACYAENPGTRLLVYNML